MLLQIVGQVLGHSFGKSRDQDSLIVGDAQHDFRKHVVDLSLGRSNLDFRIDKPGRPDELLDDIV